MQYSNKTPFPDLIQQLTEGKVVPFVGSGVSRGIKRRDNGKPLFPNWRELLKAASEALAKDGKVKDARAYAGMLELDSPNLPLLAAELQKKLSRPDWLRVLLNELDVSCDLAEPSSLEVIRLIWCLGSNLVVTTNYDRSLHWGCPNPLDVGVLDIENPAELSDIHRGGIIHPTVWHLHGYIRNRNNIILTEAEYSKLYSSTKSYKAAHEALRYLLASKTLLFLGCSMADTHFVDLLKKMSKLFRDTAGHHYVLLHESEEERVKSLGLPLRSVTFPDFEDGLRDRLETFCDSASAGSNRIRALYEGYHREKDIGIGTIKSDPIEHYIETLRSSRRKYSENTIRNYRVELSLAQKYLKKSLTKATDEEIGRWLKDQRASSLEVSSVIKKLRILKKFYSFCVDNKLTRHNPALSISDLEMPDPKYELATEADVTRLYSTVGSETSRDRLHRAVILLIGEAGARTKEVVELNIADVKTGARMVTLGSGASRRELRMSEQLTRAIEDWLAVHPSGRGRLFVKTSKPYRDINYDNIYILLKQRSTNAGIQPIIKPTMLRNYFVHNTINRGNGSAEFSLEDIAKIIGTVHMNTTHGYVKRYKQSGSQR